MDPNGEKISHSYQYETDNLYTAFYIMMYNMIGINNSYVKICGNCGRYFLTPKATIAYCDRIVEGELTCKDIGSKDYQKRKLATDAIYNLYRKIGSRKQLRANRNPEIEIYQKDLKQYREHGKQMYKDVCDGKISNEDFAKWIKEQDK